MQAPTHLVASPAPLPSGHDSYNSFLGTDRRDDDSREYNSFEVFIPPLSSSFASSTAAAAAAVATATTTTTTATTTAMSAPHLMNKKGTSCVGPSPASVSYPSPLVRSSIAAQPLPQSQSQSPPRPSARAPPPPVFVPSADTFDPSPSLIGTRDLQRGILEQKVQALQRESAALREDLKETTARLSDVTMRLNEQKVESSALTHRYGACVEKLTVAEGSVTVLEEQLVAERQQHFAACEARDELRGALREADWELERLRADLAAERARPAMDSREVQRLLSDRSRYIPTEEVQRRCDDAVREAQYTQSTRLSSALDGIMSLQKSGETALFVARSAVQSAATDLEARVAAAEATLSSLRDQLTLFNGDSERDVADLVAALLVENKELWQRLARLKEERETAVAQLRRRRGGDDDGEDAMVPREEHLYVQRQLALTTARLSEAQSAVESLTAVARTHEAEMRAALAEARSLAEDFEAEATRERDRADKQAAVLTEARATCAEALRRAEEFEAAAQAQQSQCAALRAEVDEARALCARETEALCAREAKEQQVQRQQRQEIDELRRESCAKAAEVEALRIEVESLRAEAVKLQQREAEARAALRQREADAAALREALRDEKTRVTEAQRERERDEKAREERKQREVLEHSALLEQLDLFEQQQREAEAETIRLREDIAKLRAEAAAARRQWDREAQAEPREALRDENARLHEAHEAALREAVQLREALLLARREQKGGGELAAQLSDLQQRLRQLPALRAAAEAARREATEARDETDALRRERDAMAAKLDFFLEESRRAVRKDEEWARVFRDAAEQSQRLGGQIAAVRAHGYAAQQTHGQRVVAAQAELDTEQPQAPMHRPWR